MNACCNHIHTRGGRLDFVAFHKIYVWIK